MQNSESSAERRPRPAYGMCEPTVRADLNDVLCARNHSVGRELGWGGAGRQIFGNGVGTGSDFRGADPAFGDALGFFLQQRLEFLNLIRLRLAREGAAEGVSDPLSIALAPFSQR